jgi:hypothetical protein
MKAELPEGNVKVDRGMLVESPNGWKIDTKSKSIFEGLIQPERIEVER